MKRTRHYLWSALAAIAIASCGDSPIAPTRPAPDPSITLFEGAVVSRPVTLPVPINPSGVPARSVASLTQPVSFVSVIPGTLDGASAAMITNLRNGASVTVPMIDGGFDPTALPAAIGDTIEISAALAGGRTANSVILVDDVAPSIIRTKPPQGQTDVPVNTNITIVFSEPVSVSSLNSSSISLRQGESEVDATATVSPTSLFIVVLVPAAALAPSTQYTVVVTSDVTNLAGTALGAGLASIFTTTPATQPVVALAATWDWFEEIADPASGTVCADTGSFTISQIGTLLSGTWIQTGACVRETIRSLNTKTATLTNGVAGVDETQFSVVAGSTSCFYRGNVNLEQTTIVGTVVCGSYSGTWQAERAPSIAAVDVSQTGAPLNSLIIGETRTLRADLTNSSGRRAFRSGVIWSTSDNRIATISPNSEQTAVLRTFGAGTVTITATIESASRGVPVVVRTFTLTNVAVGTLNSCGADAEGIVYCWNMTARRMFGGPQLTSLSLGAGQGCGLDATGVAHCWLDSDEITGAGMVSPVATSLRFATISVGGWINGYYYYYYEGTAMPHVCATTADGTAYCWGDGSYGQLGYNPTGSAAESPGAVATSVRFSSVSAGTEHSCGISTAGRAYCWGGNWSGQLGDGTDIQRLVPVEVAGPTNFASIYAARGHTCALTPAGAAWCWGANGNGVLGVLAGNARLTPVAVDGGLVFAKLAAGAYHTCGLTTAGDVYCWGGNGYRELGPGVFNVSSSVPVRVTGAPKFTDVSSSAGAHHTCGLATDQRVYCWGDAGYVGGGNNPVLGPNAVLGQR